MPKKLETLLIEDSIFPNMGIGRLDDTTYRIKGALPGQKVQFIKKKKREHYREGKLYDIVERSPLERAIPCPHFDECGGCSYQSLPYESELLLKAMSLRNLFKEKGYDLDISIRRSPRVKAYRNKMEYSFGDYVKGGPLVLGLHQRNRYYSIVDVPSCNIIHPDMELIRQEVQTFFRELNTPFYHNRKREGYLRHCIIRKALTTGEIMVNLVTTTQYTLPQEFVELLLDRLFALPLEGELVSIYHTENDALSDAVIPENLELWFGKSSITEKLLGLEFEVGPFSFFQPNVYGAEGLYQKAIEVSGDLSGKLVYDLYCGTGTITQILAQSARKVIGVEIVEEAVEKAKLSAWQNEIFNVEFRANDVLKELDNLSMDADHIFVDPPREGLHSKVLEKIAITGCPLTYISCNPVSLLRDIKRLEEYGYKLNFLTAYDQFPRTVHVEMIALLQKEKLGK